MEFEVFAVFHQALERKFQFFERQLEIIQALLSFEQLCR